MQALAEQSRLVRLPLNKVGSLGKINKALTKLEQQYEREPTAEELSEVLEMNAEEIHKTMEISARHVSVDAPFEEGENHSLLHTLENEDARKAEKEIEHKSSLCIETERTLSTLKEREREVIKKFFGIGIEHPMSLEDIGDSLEITRERVRQIKDKAIQKLRSQAKNKLLQAYLGV